MLHTALVGNKTDMSHLRSISRTSITPRKKMICTLLCGKKTGDMVSSSFFRIAADLAGVVLTQNRNGCCQSFRQATIVDYKRNDEHEKRPAKVQQRDGGKAARFNEIRADCAKSLR